MSFCKICGNENPTETRRPRKYCSSDCSFEAFHGRKKMQRQTHCDYCKKEIPETRSRLARTCSEDCKKAKENLRSKKRNKPVQTKNCVICNAQFQTPRSNQYCCSQPCTFEHTKRTARKRLEEERKARPDFKELPCTWCQKPVIIRSNFPGLKVTHDDCKKERTKATNRTKNTKRRGYQLSRQRIGIGSIGDRDGWVCHICQKHVDPFLPGNHKEGPTFDHVIPLSKGGSDEPENLKLAHWICNIRKLDKVDYAQSR